MAGDDDLPTLDDLPSLGAPTFDDAVAMAELDVLPKFGQLARQLDPRLRRPMSRWRLIVLLLRDPEAATRDLAERLNAWPHSSHYRVIEDAQPGVLGPRARGFIVARLRGGGRRRRGGGV